MIDLYNIKNGEQRLNFSIDRLTIVAEFKHRDYFYQILNHVERLEDTTKYNNLTTFFEKSYNIDGLGMIQLDLNSNKIRIDFNPNNITLIGKEKLNYILMFVENIHYTRLDLAIDLFNYNIKNYNIIDIGNRKSAYFYDRVGKLETIYSGSMKSSKYIRIYNKAVEQKIKNMDWWRFEIQLRDVYIDKYLNELIEFYQDILVFQYTTINKYSTEENAIIEYLLRDISRLDRLGKNQKTKYRNIIKSLELSSIDFFDSILSLTSNKVIEYLNYISSNKIYPETNISSCNSLKL